MRRKPRGPRYRNLHSRGGVIYYERVAHGRRIKLSAKTPDWDEAAAFRDLYEARKGIGTRVPILHKVPTFAEFAERYLAEDTGHLAATTRVDVESYLREHGPLITHFGDRRLDDISGPRLREWWSLEVEAKRRSVVTGRHFLNTLAAVLGYAVELGLVEDLAPLESLRATLRRKGRTQRGRAQAQAGRKVAPVEEPAELRKIVTEAEAESAEALVLVLLCLDAGLRLGEAMALRWGSIVWGDDQNDPRRSLDVSEARSRGGAAGPPKSGRARRVALSRRLREALALLYRSRFEPGPSAVVLEGVDPSNFRRREWRRICKRADVGHRALKDLRDTFASQLLTAGVQLGYISNQLGHSTVELTARHYARWIDRGEYVEPLVLEHADIPADLLARLGGKSHHTPTSRRSPSEAVHDDGSGSAALPWSGRSDSNRRPSAPKAVRRAA